LCSPPAAGASCSSRCSTTWWTCASGAAGASRRLDRLEPITLYLATALVDFSRIAERLAGGSVATFFDTHIANGAGALLLAVMTLGLLLLLARFLHRRQIYLRV